MDKLETVRSGEILDPFDSPEGEVVRFTMWRSIEQLAPDPPLSFGYRLEPFTAPILPAFAAVLAVSFSDSTDLRLYPRLSSRDGCLSLLKELSNGPGFLPGASWMALFNKEPSALIMASRSQDMTFGQIQVVAVSPRHRRVGVGRHLVSKSLWALRDRHITRVILRVNRSNRIAIRFFRSIGFQVSESKTFL